MRLTTLTSIAASTMAIALLLTASAAAAAVKPACDDVLAKVSTVQIDDATEFGEIAGFLNGAIYIRYPVKADPLLEEPSGKPNVVIYTKKGTLYFWMSVTSIELPDGTYRRQMRTLRATGTGDFTRASINFTINGTYSGKGGGYEVIGAICKSPIIGPAK